MPGFFKRIEKKYAWSFLGVVATIIFGIVGLYSFLHEKQPSILFDITSEANVLDVREPLRDLAISFQGQDIQQKNLNLRIFAIRVENNGEVDILQGHYDQNEIWGSSVDGGKIIEVRLINTNSDYLRSNLNPRLINENTIQLNKTIFERGKFFALEVLVLHDKDSLPQITPIGKIAGIDSITPVKSWLEKDKQTFLTKLLFGNILVHLVRFVGYIVIVVVVFGTVISIGGVISDRSAKRKAERRISTVADILKANKIELDKEKNEILVEVFVNQGLEGLVSLHKQLSGDEDKLRNLVQKQKIRKEAERQLAEIGPPGREFMVDMSDAYITEHVLATGQIRRFHRWPEVVVHNLIEKGVVNLDEHNRISIDPNFKQALEVLIDSVDRPKRQELPSY